MTTGYFLCDYPHPKNPPEIFFISKDWKVNNTLQSNGWYFIQYAFQYTVFLPIMSFDYLQPDLQITRPQSSHLPNI